MNNRGRAFDNIFVERLWRSAKHEDLYLKGYITMGQSLIGLTAYFAFYNEERPRQSLANQTPDAVYQTASGGASIILEKYGASLPETSDPRRSSDIFGVILEDVQAIETTEEKTGQSRPAASELEPIVLTPAKSCLEFLFHFTGRTHRGRYLDLHCPTGRQGLGPPGPVCK